MWYPRPPEKTSRMAFSSNPKSDRRKSSYRWNWSRRKCAVASFAGSGAAITLAIEAMALRVGGRSAEEPVNMLTIAWIGARARVADETDPRLVGDVGALRSPLRRDSLGRPDDRRVP